MRQIYIYIYMGVSKNNGTPKSSILIGFSIINHPFWGTTIFGNIHIYIYTYIYTHIYIYIYSTYTRNPPRLGGCHFPNRAPSGLPPQIPNLHCGPKTRGRADFRSYKLSHESNTFNQKEEKKTFREKK